MIERGFSTDDILRVLAGGQSPHAVASADPTSLFIEQGYQGSDIAAITTALDRVPAARRDEVERHVRQMAEGSYDGSDIVKFVDARAQAAKMTGGTPATA